MATLRKQNIANAGTSFPAGYFQASNSAELQAVVLTDSDGNEIPVSGTSLDGYVISDLDEAAATKYYGFLTASGGWYILKLTSTAARYVKGDSGYTTAWTDRATQTYDYYDAVF